MTEAEQQDGKIDAFRILTALGHIGYTPVSAIFDIVDNSVAAKAGVIQIDFALEPGIGETRKNSVRSYIIADNGEGMDRAGLGNALQLGSPLIYDEHSLSKFGMGLKSAALSQGDQLTLLSKTPVTELDKVALDMDVIRKVGSYALLFGGLTAKDRQLWDRYLPDAASGTIVVIEKIHKVNHPSARSTRDELARRIGVYYHYFIAENGLDVRLDGESAKPFDPLFIEEADLQDQLDSSTWDGSTVRWSLMPTSITLDAERNVKATLSVTQLPHPFTFGDDRTAVRRKYMIGPGNYGFYVYRNRRLISWADRFDGIIPYDQEYWSFRGRLFIEDDADDVLNVDVKKSRVLLSEEAHQSLDDITYELRLKSRNAWRAAFRRYKEKLGADAEQVANEALNNVVLPESLPTDPDDAKSEDERTKRSKRLAERRPMKESEKENVQEKGQRVQFVASLDDNVLWERAHDAELGTVVRLNRSHRFVRDVYSYYQNDRMASLVLHSIFYGLAHSEGYAIKALQTHTEKDLEAIFLRFREITSQFLSKLTNDAIGPAIEEGRE